MSGRLGMWHRCKKFALETSCSSSLILGGCATHEWFILLCSWSGHPRPVNHCCGPMITSVWKISDSDQVRTSATIQSYNPVIALMKSISKSAEASWVYWKRSQKILIHILFPAVVLKPGVLKNCQTWWKLYTRTCPLRCAQRWGSLPSRVPLVYFNIQIISFFENATLHEYVELHAHENTSHYLLWVSSRLWKSLLLFSTYLRLWKGTSTSWEYSTMSSCENLSLTKKSDSLWHARFSF